MSDNDECDLDMLSALMDEDSSNDGTATASARDEAKLQHADDNKEADAAEDEIDEDTLAELFADSDYEDDLTAPPVEKSSNQKSSCTPNTENVGNGISDPLQPCSTASPAAAAPEKFANVFDRMAADVEGAKTTSAGESSEDKSKQDLERELKMMREKMERMQQQLMQVQGSPPAAQGTSSLAHQGTPSLAHQGTTSLAHQGTTSLAHQGTTSLAHQGTRSLAHQGTTSLAHQGTRSLAHQGNSSLASQGTTTLTLKSPSADPSKRAAPVYTEVAENPFFPSKSPQQTPQRRRSKARGEKVAPPSGKTSRQETQGSSLVHTGESDEEMDEYGGGVVREELEGPSPEQQWGKNKPRVAHPASLSDEVIPRSKPATWKTPVNVISSNRKFLGGSTFVKEGSNQVVCQ
ncbi:PREDICTED: uncharacterized protein LOC106818620 [Priapulus caudatus]|uniref:Uncharacterized protein LOC106818620 n=1 Tax=Priapulus caudatus TaxID=37621 RepID=A0ABM1F2X6_PRICU|nr:PREDICTED: uncharacterized protein LOC106818620 [Priapulus caudatus]